MDPLFPHYCTIERLVVKVLANSIFPAILVQTLKVELLQVGVAAGGPPPPPPFFAGCAVRTKKAFLACAKGGGGRRRNHPTTGTPASHFPCSHGPPPSRVPFRQKKGSGGGRPSSSLPLISNVAPKDAAQSSRHVNSMGREGERGGPSSSRLSPLALYLSRWAPNDPKEIEIRRGELAACMLLALWSNFVAEIVIRK